MRRSIIGALVGAAVASAILLTPRIVERPWPRLPTPEYLPVAARTVLHSRMQRHREQVTLVQRSVIALDYVATAQWARAIAEEPRLGRPLENDATDLNSQLPERFFELQEELRQKARALETAAVRADDDAVASAHEELAKTCLACHRLYVRGKP